MAKKKDVVTNEAAPKVEEPKLSKRLAFLIIAENRRLRIKNKTDLDYMLMAIKDTTNSISFGCTFVDGKCQRVIKYPKIQSSSDTFKVGCCCGECEKKMGYLEIIFFDHLDEYANAWSPKTGFFKPNEGCQLPRKLRSKTCLCYSCNETPAQNEFVEKVLILLRNYS